MIECAGEAGARSEGGDRWDYLGGGMARLAVSST